MISKRLVNPATVKTSRTLAVGAASTSVLPRAQILGCDHKYAKPGAGNIKEVGEIENDTLV